MQEPRKMAIIGIGPRGGFALEKLVLELAEQSSLQHLKLLLFEVSGNYGNGPIYKLDQSPSNWINITERVLDLESRKEIKTDDLTIPPFPSYKEWCDKQFQQAANEEIDTYPPRSKIGAFLSQRFESLAKPLMQANLIDLHKEKVLEVDILDNQKIALHTDLNSNADIDELLITIGHQMTEFSPQILKWDEFVLYKEKLNLFKSAYPIKNILSHKNLTENSTLGIRGFGLTMIDVVRAIGEKFGEFKITDPKTKACSYHASSKLKNLFVPFSLEGLPPVPKPLNAKIDNFFEPESDLLSSFEAQIGNEKIQKQAQSPEFLIEAFAPLAAKVYCNLANSNNDENLTQKEVEKVVLNYMKDHDYQHSTLVPAERSAIKSMKDYVAMACGKMAVSLDFCIGQVWRHCQPTIYKALAFNKCSDDVIAEVVALDEWTKRYSYGPPVESIQQLIALYESEVLNLDFINDPEIKLTDQGWKLKLNQKSITATIMIDSVLDAPQIKAVNSPIVLNMLNDDLLSAIHDKLGVYTDKHAYLITENKDQKLPIALIGRLAKGTIIGSDAILECFGFQPKLWAKQAAKNHIAWLNN